MADADRARWDRRHESLVSAGSDEPGPPHLFAPYADLFPRSGHALELACGRGRAAVWLASRGMDVWGLDVSPVAIARATELARRMAGGARCRFDVVDLDDGLPPGPRVDLVLCHKFRDPRLDAAVVDRLAPGGLLAIAALSEVGGTPGPHRAARGELARSFAGLDALASGEADGEAWLLARRRPAVDGGRGDAGWGGPSSSSAGRLGSAGEQVLDHPVDVHRSSRRQRGEWEPRGVLVRFAADHGAGAGGDLVADRPVRGAGVTSAPG